MPGNEERVRECNGRSSTHHDRLSLCICGSSEMVPFSRISSTLTFASVGPARRAAVATAWVEARGGNGH